MRDKPPITHKIDIQPIHPIVYWVISVVFKVCSSMCNIL